MAQTSATVITFNEEEDLEGCLESLAYAMNEQRDDLRSPQLIQKRQPGPSPE